MPEFTGRFSGPKPNFVQESNINPLLFFYKVKEKTTALWAAIFFVEDLYSDG
jgi:hypothetical protein